MAIQRIPYATNLCRSHHPREGRRLLLDKLITLGSPEATEPRSGWGKGNGIPWPSRTECQVGPTILVDRPVPEPPPLTSSDFRCGPATLRGRVQSMGDGFGGAFKFRPLDFGPSIKMMLYPRVRNSAWEMRAAQIGTPYNRPMGPDQTRCHEGPTILVDRPRQEPSPPHVIGFPLWAGRKERCCKSGGISGNFRRCWCGSQTVGALQMKIVSQCREQARWVYDYRHV
jgi:hypothetical protein